MKNKQLLCVFFDDFWGSTELYQSSAPLQFWLFFAQQHTVAQRLYHAMSILSPGAAKAKRKTDTESKAKMIGIDLLDLSSPGERSHLCLKQHKHTDYTKKANKMKTK